MMIRRPIAFTISLLTAACLYAGTVCGQSYKQVEVVGDSIQNKDVFFVSDIHYHNGSLAFIGSMSEYANRQYGITTVALEMSRSLAWLINTYIHGGDSTVFFYMRKPINKVMLRHLRDVNATLPANMQITVCGVDYERMEFVKVLQLLLGKYDNAQQTALYKFAFSFSDSLSRLGDRRDSRQSDLWETSYSKAAKIFNLEKDMLMAILGADFLPVQQILTNPVMYDRFKKRNEEMYTSLMQQVNDSKFICFLGGQHIDPYIHGTIPSRFMEQTGRKDITLVTEVCRNYQDYNGTYITIGPKFIIEQDTIMTHGYGKYQKEGYYNLVDQRVFGQLMEKDNKGFDTYYVFSDLLKE